MALKYEWRDGRVWVSPLTVTRLVLSGTHFQIAQQWMVDSGGDHGVAAEDVPTFAVADDTKLLDAYLNLKKVQLQHRDAGAGGDAVVRLEPVTDRGMGTLMYVLLVLVCQYEHECREDGSMPRVCVALAPRDRLKAQELLALLQPCGVDEYVTSEQLVDFIGLICKQWNRPV